MTNEPASTANQPASPEPIQSIAPVAMAQSPATTPIPAAASQPPQPPQPPEQPPQPAQPAPAPPAPTAVPQAPAVVRVEEVQRPGGASDELEPVFMPFSLTVGDGFKFGCGLSIALGTALLIGVLILLIITLAANLAGIPTPLTPR